MSTSMSMDGLAARIMDDVRKGNKVRVELSTEVIVVTNMQSLAWGDNDGGYDLTVEREKKMEDPSS